MAAQDMAGVPRNQPYKGYKNNFLGGIPMDNIWVSEKKGRLIKRPLTVNCEYVLLSTNRPVHSF